MIIKCTSDDSPHSPPAHGASSTKSRDRIAPHIFDSEPQTPTRGTFIGQNLRKYVRITLTTALYIVITQCYHLMDTPTVVYTCSDGRKNVAPRAVNTRFNTIFESIDSSHSEKAEDYFCKVRAARDMLVRHPGKRIVYVDSDMVIDLEALIQDVGCSRLSFAVHPWLGHDIVQTSTFCFPANEGSREVLDRWWALRTEYPKRKGGLKDQGAMNDMLLSPKPKETVTVLVFDETGINMGHCSHAVGSERGWPARDRCKDNLDTFARWDRAIVLVVAWLKFALWLLPLALAYGYPLLVPRVLGTLLNVNPLTLLAALGLPRVLSKLLVRNNRVSGTLEVFHTGYVSGFFVHNIGSQQRFWLPTVGLLQWPNLEIDRFWLLAYPAALLCLVIFRHRLDRWTCITCPTLYHWLAWSKSAADRCSAIAGKGRWLSVTATGPNMYHLDSGSNTKSLMGVPVERIHGQAGSFPGEAGDDHRGDDDDACGMHGGHDLETREGARSSRGGPASLRGATSHSPHPLCSSAQLVTSHDKQEQLRQDRQSIQAAYRPQIFDALRHSDYVRAEWLRGMRDEELLQLL